MWSARCRFSLPAPSAFWRPVLPQRIGRLFLLQLGRVGAARASLHPLAVLSLPVRKVAETTRAPVDAGESDDTGAPASLEPPASKLKTRTPLEVTGGRRGSVVPRGSALERGAPIPPRVAEGRESSAHALTTSKHHAGRLRRLEPQAVGAFHRRATDEILRPLPAGFRFLGFACTSRCGPACHLPFVMFPRHPARRRRRCRRRRAP
jgi:hypothetical protein